MTTITKQYSTIVSEFLKSTYKLGVFQDSENMAKMEITQFVSMLKPFAFLFDKYPSIDNFVANHINNYKPFQKIGLPIIEKNLIQLRGLDSLIAQNKNLLVKFPKFETFILSQINQQDFNQSFEYSHLQKQFVELENFKKLIESKKQVIDRHTNLSNSIDSFIKNLDYSVVVNRNLIENNISNVEKYDALVNRYSSQVVKFPSFEVDLKQYINNFNFNNSFEFSKIETELRMLDTLFSEIQDILMPIYRKVKKYADRYNIVNLCGQVEKVVTNARKSLIIGSVANCLSTINQLTTELQACESSFEDETLFMNQFLQKLQVSNIWSEDLQQLENKVNQLLPNLYVTNVNVNDFDTILLSKIKEKSIYINEFKGNQSQKGTLVNGDFDSNIKKFENSSCSKRDFDNWCTQYLNGERKRAIIRITKISFLAILVNTLILYISSFHLYAISITFISVVGLGILIWHHLFRKK